MKDFLLCCAVIILYPIRTAFVIPAMIWELSGVGLEKTGKFRRDLFIEEIKR